MIRGNRGGDFHGRRDTGDGLVEKYLKNVEKCDILGKEFEKSKLQRNNYAKKDISATQKTEEARAWLHEEK